MYEFCRWYLLHPLMQPLGLCLTMSQEGLNFWQDTYTNRVYSSNGVYGSIKCCVSLRKRPGMGRVASKCWLLPSGIPMTSLLFCSASHKTPSAILLVFTSSSKLSSSLTFQAASFRGFPSQMHEPVAQGLHTKLPFSLLPVWVSNWLMFLSTLMLHLVWLPQCVLLALQVYPSTQYSYPSLRFPVVVRLCIGSPYYEPEYNCHNVSCHFSFHHNKSLNTLHSNCALLFFYSIKI